MTATKTIALRYYALLKDLCGRDTESRSTASKTARDLYAELDKQYALNLPVEKLQVAVNNELSSWDTPIRDGDHVSLLPPVAGG